MLAPFEQLMPLKTLVDLGFVRNSFTSASMELWTISKICLGSSGRSLRRLPFLAYVSLYGSQPTSGVAMARKGGRNGSLSGSLRRSDHAPTLDTYLRALQAAARNDVAEREKLAQPATTTLPGKSMANDTAP